MLNPLIKTISLLAFCVSLSATAAESPTTKSPTTKNTLTAQQPLPIMRGVGGDFTAVGVDGKPFQLSRYNDKIVLLFFGYTNCADICPFTLGYLKSLYEKLTPAEQEKVQIVFVTVDPEYDTPEHLREYVAFFNKDFTAATGSREQIDAIVKQYQATYSKISADEKVKTKEMRRVNQKDVADKNTDAAYVYSHSVNIYVMDGQLRVRKLEYTGTQQNEFRQTLRRLIAEQSGKATEKSSAEKTPTDKQKADNIPQKNTADSKPSPKQSAEQTNEATTKSTKKPSNNGSNNAQADNVKLPVLLNYWIHLGPSNTRVMAAYGDFVNTSNQDIYLVGAENPDFDHAELHESVVEDNVGKMLEHKAFLIPAGQILKFEFNQRHIMLVTPFRELKHNGKSTMTLKYRLPDSDKIYTQTMEFPVSFDGEGCGSMPLYLSK